MKRWEFDRAVQASALHGIARALLLHLAVLADWPGGKVPPRYSPSLSELAEKSGFSRRAVAMHLNAAEEAGWLVRTRPDVAKARADKDTTVYGLRAPASARHALASAPDAPELVHDMHWASARGAHKPVLTNTKPAAAAAADFVATQTGATDEVAERVVADLVEEKNPRSLIGLLRRLDADGDLADRAKAATERLAAGRIEQELAQLRTGEPCPHGQHGGELPHPSTGQPLCPLCRRIAARKVVA